VALNTITSVSFLLLGGAIADRVARRTLIVVSDVVGGIVVAALALLSATGQLRVDHVYVSAVALGATDAFLRPAYTAIIADLVPAEILRAGNAARLLGRSLSRIAGPTVGGFAVAFGGPALAFAMNAGTFVFSFATLLLTSTPTRVLRVSTSLGRDVREGIGYVLGVRWLWTTNLYFMLVNVAYAGQMGVMTPLLVRDQLGGDAVLFGMITTAYGVGTIVASVVVAQLTPRRPGQLLFVYELLGAVSVLGIGLVPTVPVVAISMALMGVALSSSTVIWEALLQRHVPTSVLGRVASIDLLGNSVINPVAPIVAAALVASLGAANTFVVAGVYALAAATVALVASPLRLIEERNGASA
jgi:MFS family permease